MAKEIYRKSVLERISSPDQLDKAIKITSPLSWLALIGVTLIILATAIWSVKGTIPVTVSSSAIIASPVSTNCIYTEYSGIITKVYVSQEEEVSFGTPVMEITASNGARYDILSDQYGRVSEIISAEGDSVTQNSEVIRISPSIFNEGNKVVVAYVPISNAKKIKRDMKANVTLMSANSQSYGHMVARVINIDSLAASTASMNYVLGADNNLYSAIANGNAVVSVACELYPDETSDNGYYWSNEKGKKLSVENGSLCSVKIITDEIAPISKLFDKIDEIWGGK